MPQLQANHTGLAVQYELQPIKMVRKHTIVVHRIVNDEKKLALVCRCGWVATFSGYLKLDSKTLEKLILSHDDSR